MPHRQANLPLNPAMPATREPVSLLAVDRGVFELRRGRIVCVTGAQGSLSLVLAAEGINDKSLKDLNALAHALPHLAITQCRAKVLGLKSDSAFEGAVFQVLMPAKITTDEIVRLSNPLAGEIGEPDDQSQISSKSAPQHGPDAAAIGLTKIARLLPAALVVTVKDPDATDFAQWAARRNLILVDAGDVFQYENTAARTLTRVSEAPVPLEGAENTRVVAFRPHDGGLEHLAIIIGEPEQQTQPPLVRLHSECFTGDLLGSLRCDCGDQLRGAIQAISNDGGGVLLYLAQEGRGIGLVNKLRAYTLQDQGSDTLDANEQLGFDADERVYLPAVHMLKDLGFTRIRLLTNNPGKVQALEHSGIEIVDRVRHVFPSNKHNEQYLETKKVKGGHLF